jgi:ABC-2 type transport system permease protein
MKTYIELVKANAKNLFRDRMTLFWFLAFPVLFILLFGTIFSNEMTVSAFPIGLVADGGEVAHALASTLGQTGAFTVQTGSEEDEMEALRAGDRRLVIVLPPGTDALLARGQQVDVIFYYDQQHQAVNQVLISSISEVLQEMERAMTGRPRIFAIRSESVQASDLRSIDFLLPGVLAMALMQLGLFGSLQFVGLRERKILRQLNVTPLPRSLLIASEVTVRLFMALVQAMLILVIGRLVFNVQVAGSWPVLIGLVLLGAAVFVSLGYMLVSFVKSEESGQGVIQLVQFPMMFLSGIFFPVEVMPVFLKPIMKAIPLTYLADLLRQEVTGWAPLNTPATNLLVLGGWLVVSLVLGIRFFRWE